MSKAIIASVIALCFNWWFTTLCVMCCWGVYGALVLLSEAAEGGAFK